MKKSIIGLLTLISFSSFASTRCVNDLYNKIVWGDKIISKKMFLLSDATEQAIKDGNEQLAKKLSAKSNALSRSAVKIAEIACEK